MPYKVQITDGARAEANEYALFMVSEHGASRPALRWLDGLYEGISSLRDMPSRFPVIPEAEEVGQELRSILYHSHRIVYKVDEDARTVTVIRVYHSARRPLHKQDLWQD